MFPLQQVHGEAQFVERVAATLIGAHRLAAAADEVVRVEIRQRRMAVEETHQTRQQPWLQQEGAGCRRRPAEGDLATTAGVRHGAVEVEPVGGKALFGGCSVDLAAAQEEIRRVDARCAIDLDDRRVGRHRRPLDCRIHRRWIAGQDQRRYLAGQRSFRDALQYGQEQGDPGEQGQLDARRRPSVHLVAAQDEEVGAGLREFVMQATGRSRTGMHRGAAQPGIVGIGEGGRRIGAHQQAPFSGGGRGQWCDQEAARGQLGGQGGRPAIEIECIAVPRGGCRVAQRQERVGRPVPDRGAVPPTIKAKIPTRLFLAGVLPSDTAQHYATGVTPTQAAEQRFGTAFLVTAEGLAQPLRRMGGPVGEGRFRANPDGQAHRGDLRVVMAYGRRESVFRSHVLVLP